MIKQVFKALRITAILWFITAVIYPSLICAVGMLPFIGEKATASIIYNLENQPIGSSLIGQVFTSDKYFQSRPSTIRYSQGKQAKPTGISGASNFAPSNPKLVSRVVEKYSQFRDDNLQPPADLIYTSASGLDPHISIRAARLQLERVARSRNIEPDEIRGLVNKSTDGRFLGIFGEPGVNVLKLNYNLDLYDFNRQQNK
ncbi:K(+)-transporting ATPase subunit C [Calothrix sp. PCC 6303]|uniref:K(+)-transporting ATPase subunit C n=1 Tax=Calothrix sp. PCC 6303 TaxID=1170562 RepID=UPI0002A00D81|nr:K(+)-transporting ATPase subunit C [Calothrix sp. PCC 6303]AFZ03863.1 Potassium-transporting ATPase C chain [Calothrix sp. PCC 6303]